MISRAVGRLAAFFPGVIGFLTSHYIYFRHSSLIQSNHSALFTSSLQSPSKILLKRALHWTNHHLPNSDASYPLSLIGGGDNPGYLNKLPFCVITACFIWPQYGGPTPIGNEVIASTSWIVYILTSIWSAVNMYVWTSLLRQNSTAVNPPPGDDQSLLRLPPTSLYHPLTLAIDKSRGHRFRYAWNILSITDVKQSLPQRSFITPTLTSHWLRFAI